MTEDFISSGDISMYNEANKCMQAADANIMECKGTVDAFTMVKMCFPQEKG